MIMDQRKEVLGTVVRVVAGAEFLDMAFSEFERIDRDFSRFRDGNEVGVLNASIGRWVSVSEELFELIGIGEKVRIVTGGAFDLTVEGVLRNWGYDKEYSFEDGDEEGGLGEIEMRDEGLLVRVSAPIDLGGLGKGYALERVAGILDEAGCERFLLDAGGDIYARGGGWKVAFEHPFKGDEAIGTVEVDDFYLASSSANRRRWGMKHHLVCVHDLRPADDMEAVYVQGENGAEVDAWSTALFVVGFAKAKEMVDNSYVEAMLIGKSGEIFRSGGFKGKLFMEAQ